MKRESAMFFSVATWKGRESQLCSSLLLLGREERVSYVLLCCYLEGKRESAMFFSVATWK